MKISGLDVFLVACSLGVFVFQLQPLKWKVEKQCSLFYYVLPFGSEP